MSKRHHRVPPYRLWRFKQNKKLFKKFLRIIIVSKLNNLYAHETRKVNSKFAFGDSHKVPSYDTLESRNEKTDTGPT